MNEHHQILAHLAVLSRYTTLLQKVAQWGIDVDVQAVNWLLLAWHSYPVPGRSVGEGLGRPFSTG